jgi:hypothetical protein
LSKDGLASARVSRQWPRRCRLKSVCRYACRDWPRSGKPTVVIASGNDRIVARICTLFARLGSLPVRGYRGGGWPAVALAGLRTAATPYRRRQFAPYWSHQVFQMGPRRR